MQPLPTRASTTPRAWSPKGYMGAWYMSFFFLVFFFFCRCCCFPREGCLMLLWPPEPLPCDLLQGKCQPRPCGTTSFAGPGTSQPRHRHSKSEGRVVQMPELREAGDALGLKEWVFSSRKALKLSSFHIGVGRR